jgi:hypothetical protein
VYPVAALSYGWHIILSEMNVFNIQHRGFNIQDMEFNVQAKGFNIQDKGLNIPEISRQYRKQYKVDVGNRAASLF